MTSKSTNARINPDAFDELQSELDKANLPSPREYKLAKWFTYITLATLFASACLTCVMAYKNTINVAECIIILVGMSLVAWSVWDEHAN